MSDSEPNDDEFDNNIDNYLDELFDTETKAWPKVSRTGSLLYEDDEAARRFTETGVIERGLWPNSLFKRILPKPQFNANQPDIVECALKNDWLGVLDLKRQIPLYYKLPNCPYCNHFGRGMKKSHDGYDKTLQAIANCFWAHNEEDLVWHYNFVIKVDKKKKKSG